MKKKIIYVCNFSHLEELIACPYYEWTLTPYKCNWKSISDECLNKKAVEYWKKKNEKMV